MGRYYLNIQKPDGSILENPEGSELPGLQAAREEAIEAARMLLAAAILDKSKVIAKAIIVMDDHGHELGYVPLSAVLPRDLRPHRRLDS